MKLKFEKVYRGFLALCLILLFWSVYASAQTNTLSRVARAAAQPETAERVKPIADSIMGIDRATIDQILEQYPWLEKVQILGNPLWKYIASFVYIFLAFYVSKAMDYLVGVWLKKWAKKTTTQFDDLLLELVHGPVKIVSFVIFLHIGLSVFDWPAIIEKIISKCLLIVVAVSLTYMVMKLVDLLMGYWQERTKHEEDRAFNDQLYPIVRKSMKLFVLVVAVLMTTANLGIDITTALASLSIGGLAIGLAAQDTLANLFGAVAVFLDKPFRIGDRIRLDTVDGTVETIGLRSTRVRNLDGFLVTIPNKTMGNATITNVTRRPNIKTTMTIGVTYNTSYPKLHLAVDILREVYEKHANTQEVLVSFLNFGASSLDIQVVHWWNNTDYKAYLAGMHSMNLEIKRRFDAESIEFAFPTQTVYLRQDSEWRMTTGEAPQLPQPTAAKP